jgi:nucleotide-binding universal stress UspA family protein
MMLGLYGALPPPWKYLTRIGLIPFGTALTGSGPLYAWLGRNRCEPGAAIRVVTVEDVDAPHPQVLASPVPLTRSSRLQREVETIVARTTGSSSPADTGVAVRRGVVVPEILAEVAASGPDVLAFGYHRDGPPGIIEGSSTARQLVHTAPVSVLAIPL